MLFLLRTQTTLVRDVVLEGVPTQDMLVAIERDPETLEEADLITSMTTVGTRFHIRNLQLISWRLLDIDQRYLASMIWTVIVGDQVKFLKLKSKQHHLQLIVKSDDTSARKFFLFALAHLLPIGCVKIASNASGYINQYKLVLKFKINILNLEATFWDAI
jgi:hypothetical protein